jgi:uncharacterized membrane protein YeaQ/YmgE (transglycosylase-associated protein family)
MLPCIQQARDITDQRARTCLEFTIQQYKVLGHPARRNAMEEQAIGWIAAIIIGGIAGWLAEQFMKSEMGLLMNIVLGIVGAAVASLLFGLLGISFGPGWLGYLIAGFIGAVILIFVARAIRQRA